MLSWSSGSKRSDDVMRPGRLILALSVMPVVLLTASGCAQKQAPATAMVDPHRLLSEQTAGGPRVAGAAYANVELEDDGLEAQQPPLRNREPLVDDPAEPYSPNYGRLSS